LGPRDRDDPPAPITILGMPSASPAVIELFRNFLRVIVFIAMLTIDCYVQTLPRQREFGTLKYWAAGLGDAALRRCGAGVGPWPCSTARNLRSGPKARQKI